MLRKVVYFVDKWHRRSESAVGERVFSLLESLVNNDFTLTVASAEPANESTQRDLKDCPIDVVSLPGSQIASALSAVKKPHFAIFSSPQVEAVYSAYVLSRWPNALRILQVLQLEDLRAWRSQQYAVVGSPTIVPRGAPLYPETVFGEEVLRSMRRSDFVLCPNDFVLYLLRKQRLGPNSAVVSIGFPLQDYNFERKELLFRPFDARAHFLFLANFHSSSSRRTLDTLLREIWPRLSRRVDAELHIMGHGLRPEASREWKALKLQRVVWSGPSDNSKAIEDYRVLLNPTRVGAGCQGKTLEAWFYHTPVVTTPLGAEGLFLESVEPKFSATTDVGESAGFFDERELTGEEKEGQRRLKAYYDQNRVESTDFCFGGSYDNCTYDQFVDAACRLYSDSRAWDDAVKKAQKLICRHQGEAQMERNLKFALAAAESHALTHRASKEYAEEWTRHLSALAQQRKPK